MIPIGKILGSAAVGKALDLVKRLIPDRTEQEKVQHEESKQALKAKKAMDDVKPSDPTDRLSDGSF